MAHISPNKIAMGVGVAGALVDVSSLVSWVDGVSYTWGKPDPFQNTNPGTFSFVLDNYSGDYTPGNLNSTLATLVTEGMQVSWQLGARIVVGKILSIGFMGDEPNWGRLQISCDDMLGDASRKTLPNLPTLMVQGANPYAFYPLNDATGAQSAAEAYGLTGLTIKRDPGATCSFGVSTLAQSGETQATLAAPVSSGCSLIGSKLPAITYATNSIGYWSMWITANTFTASTYAMLSFTNGFETYAFGVYNGLYALYSNSSSYSYAGSVGTGPAFLSFEWSISGTNVTANLRKDGVIIGTITETVTAPTNAQKQITSFGLSVQDLASAGANSFTFSHIAHTQSPVSEIVANSGATEATRFTAIDSAIPQITLSALPGNLSTLPLGVANTAGQSALDALNDLARTEQGSLYATASGTLLAPTPTLAVRARDRPITPNYVFDATEISGPPPFGRDVSNVVALVTVNGPAVTVNVTTTDATITSRAGSSSTSETVLNLNQADLKAWGQDRMYRGNNVNLKTRLINIDGATTPTDRSSDLLAMKPQDRVQITGLPLKTLGFTTWDGWVIGCTETHTIDQDLFAFLLEPCMQQAIMDTHRLADSGELTLSGTITSGATSMSVATSTTIKLSTTATPYYLQIDRELVQATAVTGATPQVVTIVRGALNSTAAAHTAGATVSLYDPTSVLAF